MERSAISMKRIKNKRSPVVNSGWYHYIDSDLGSVWGGSKRGDTEILVRKILFSVRRLNRRYIYQTDEQRSKRFIKVGRYYEYMKREWRVTQMIHGIKRNFAFRNKIEARWDV
jgi:hypothetical protein